MFEIHNCSERNHACGSSKRVRIRLACKMRPKRGKWAMRRLNSHPSNHESYLTSGLPTCWRACKLPHCAIEPDVAFWYH